MFGLDWNNSETIWLNVTNVALGVVVAICLGFIAYGVVRDLLPRLRKRSAAADIDQELKDLVSSYGGHAFHVHGVGLTMADGGEEERKRRK